MKKKYIVVVRDFSPYRSQPSDEYLFALDMYYASPIVELDIESDFDKAIEEFDEKYGKYYSHFLNRNYEFVPV